MRRNISKSLMSRVPLPGIRKTVYIQAAGYERQIANKAEYKWSRVSQCDPYEMQNVNCNSMACHEINLFDTARSVRYHTENQRRSHSRFVVTCMSILAKSSRMIGRLISSGLRMRARMKSLGFFPRDPHPSPRKPHPPRYVFTHAT